jgi:hypothetical protein
MGTNSQQNCQKQDSEKRLQLAPHVIFFMRSGDLQNHDPDIFLSITLELIN